MLRKIIFFAIHQPLFLILLLVLFIGGGIYSFRTLPIEAFPDVTDIQVTVVTLYPGHASEEVEKQVTIPLEIALVGLPHSLRVFSHTQFGLSSTYITFDDEVDNYFARQQVLERVRAVELPDGIHPDLAPLSSPIGEIYRVYLKSDKYDAMELRTMQDWVVARNLKMVPGRCRRSYPRRFHQAVPGVAGYDEDEVPRGHAAAGVRRAGSRQHECRRRLHRTRRAAVHHSRRGPSPNA